MNILKGQCIPINSTRKKVSDVILIGEQPSDYYLKHPEMKHFGNYNNPNSSSDTRLQAYVCKYLGQVFVTDMVKDQKPSGAKFEEQWHTEPIHKRLLIQEIQKIGPKTIGAFGRKVERLLKQEFPQYRIVYLIHPSATRFPKNLARWDEQFRQLT